MVPRDFVFGLLVLLAIAMFTTNTGGGWHDAMIKFWICEACLIKRRSSPAKTSLPFFQLVYFCLVWCIICLSQGPVGWEIIIVGEEIFGIFPTISTQPIRGYDIKTKTFWTKQRQTPYQSTMFHKFCSFSHRRSRFRSRDIGKSVHDVMVDYYIGNNQIDWCTLSGLRISLSFKTKANAKSIGIAPPVLLFFLPSESN